MPDISKITLPSGGTYNIKDATARDAIAALEGGQYFLGLTTTALTNGATTNPIQIDGQTGTTTATRGNIAVYGNAEFIWDGTKWVEFGDLSSLGGLAYKSSVSLNKGSGDNVLGEATTFTAAASSVSFSGGSTKKALGSSATFTTTVTPSTTNIKATASGTAVGADGTASAITGFGAHSTDTFVKSVSAETNKKLVTSDASKCSFTMGTGTDAETLIIGCADRTVATGATATNGGGDSIVTGVTIGSSAAAITALGTPTTAACLTGVKVTTQPTVALATGATAGTGVISVATGISSASTSANNKDEVTAVTGVGTATAAAQTITVGTNDTVKVAVYGDLSVTTS